jgi:Tripartite tricarboxylate transporter family receptor
MDCSIHRPGPACLRHGAGADRQRHLSRSACADDRAVRGRGPGDIFARLIGQKLSEQLGQQFVIENRPGAGGNIGTGAAARAPADGYTLLVASTAVWINASLYSQIPYDPVRDFEPIIIGATSPEVLVVHPSLPAKTVQELVALVRDASCRKDRQPSRLLAALWNRSCYCVSWRNLRRRKPESLVGPSWRLRRLQFPTTPATAPIPGPNSTVLTWARAPGRKSPQYVDRGRRVPQSLGLW